MNRDDKRKIQVNEQCDDYLITIKQLGQAKLQLTITSTSQQKQYIGILSQSQQNQQQSQQQQYKQEQLKIRIINKVILNILILMEETVLKISQQKQPLFYQQNAYKKSEKYSKVINNFLLKSKNFDYLESCYKMKSNSNKTKSNSIQNVFRFTQPRIPNNSKIQRNESIEQIESPSKQCEQAQKQSQSLDRNLKQVKKEFDKQQIERSLHKQIKLSKSIVSPISPNISGLYTNSMSNSYRLNAVLEGDTASTLFKYRSASITQHTPHQSRDLYSYDDTLRRGSSIETYNIESDEIMQKSSKYQQQQQQKENDEIKQKYIQQDYNQISLPQISQSEKKLKKSIKMISSQGNLKAVYQLGKEELPDSCKNVTKFVQKSKGSLDNSQIEQYRDWNVDGENRNMQIKQMTNTLQNRNSIDSNQNSDNIKQDNKSNINISRVKHFSLHLDNRGKQQVQLNQKHVLESKIFAEMHNANKFSSHLNNLSRQPNQVKLIEEELNLYLPKELPESQTNLKTGNQDVVTSSFVNYYNQVCSCLNEFQNSLQEKNHTFDFKSYYSHFQDSIKQSEKVSAVKQMYNSFHIQTHCTDPSTPQSHLPLLNHYKNLNQIQQFKAQQIYSLLMNITENFKHLLQLKNNRKKTLKALGQILGFNEQIKSTLLDDDFLNLKRDIDFGEGFSLQTWKLVHSKNIKDIENLKKIPIQTLNGLVYVPIDEGWNMYQIFQYFNQNLFNYIQIKLLVTERQRKNDLNEYLQSINEMRLELASKPLINSKQLKELNVLDTNVQNIFERDQYIKKEQVIKRLEKYELQKGTFPFIGQLVRLKSKQIDKVQDVFRNKFKQ